jgi:hypothetical protein
MPGEAAIRTVAAATRTLFPQTSAHRALYGLHENHQAEEIEKVPASVAVYPNCDYPSPASENLQGKLAVKSYKGISQVRCSWGRFFAWCTRGECDRRFRRTDEG